MIFHGINVVSIPVPDLDIGRRFYSETLGFGTPVYDLPDAGWIEFEAGGGQGNLAITTADAESPPSGGTTVVLNVHDCRMACTELRRRGVRCEDPVEFPGYVVYCTFYDPFGNRLQMCSPAEDDTDKRSDA